ncbi:MAG: hypothetical protein VX213_07685 [Chloroflexota bacterium]|jgi:hypothetical protein|nr:hypothetical protein [Chloroflexota bacterium]
MLVFYVELAEVEEGVLLESVVAEAELSLVDFAGVSALVSEEDLESLVDVESELSLLELPLLSEGGLGRP